MSCECDRDVLLELTEVLAESRGYRLVPKEEPEGAELSDPIKELAGVCEVLPIQDLNGQINKFQAAKTALDSRIQLFEAAYRRLCQEHKRGDLQGASSYSAASKPPHPPALSHEWNYLIRAIAVAKGILQKRLAQMAYMEALKAEEPNEEA